MISPRRTARPCSSSRSRSTRSTTRPRCCETWASARRIETNGWSFATGPAADVDAVVRAYGVGSVRAAVRRDRAHRRDVPDRPRRQDRAALPRHRARRRRDPRGHRAVALTRAGSDERQLESIRRAPGRGANAPAVALDTRCSRRTFAFGSARLAREHVEVPVRDAAVHELSHPASRGIAEVGHVVAGAIAGRSW